MIRLLSRAAMSLALFLPLLASGAEAGVGRAGGRSVLCVEALAADRKGPVLFLR